MISTAATTAANDAAGFADKVRSFLVVARVKAADGLTVAEFGELLIALLRVAIDAADLMAQPGPERKEFVIAAVAALFDSVADYAVPTLAWPIWIVARPVVRTLLLSAVSGAIETLLPIVRIAA
jgi:hypothetical protein